MSLIGRAFKFTLGTAVGVGVGAAVGLLVAPESGQDLQRNLRDRVKRAKIDGLDAKLAKQSELIRRFRAEVNDPEALREFETAARAERDQAALQVG
jgi:hypothetical protein